MLPQDMDLAIVTVTIETGASRQSLALELKEDELDLLSVLEIKEMLIRRLTPEISPSDLVRSRAHAHIENTSDPCIFANCVFLNHSEAYTLTRSLTL